MRLYITNFSYETTDRELRDLFAAFGGSDVFILRERESGRSRGCGFLTVADHLAEAAIIKLHGSNFGGRQLKIAPATPRTPRAAA